MTLSRDEATVNEGATGKLFFDLFKETLVGRRKVCTRLHLSEISTITLTYYNLDTGTVINSRTAQDVKNANNVTIYTEGQVKWEIQALDAIIAGSSIAVGALEEHVAFFQWVTTDGDRGNELIPIFIKQRLKVT